MLHISDIHLRVSGNSIFAKINKIGDAIKSELYEVDNLIIMLSGDTAYSGKEAEYELGIKLLDNLKKSILNHSSIKIDFVVIPGNHDCDFSLDNAIRGILIDSVRNHETELKEEIINGIVKPQENYLFFEEIYENESLIFKDKLFKQYKFNIGENTIILNCFNTSWISELHEQPGKMLFPLEKYKSYLESAVGGLAISVFHHPLHWLEPMNNRANKELIERYSDIVLTGHEHVATFKQTSDLEKNYTGYFEGGALQTENPDESEFSLLSFDLLEEKQKISKFKWSTNMYREETTFNWSDLRIGRPKKSCFECNPDFNSYLDDVGITLNHPKKPIISLKDIYIYPDVKRLRFEDNNDGIDEYINLEEIKKKGDENKYIITGKEQVGKSTFCKIIYKHFSNEGYIPVLIDGRKINKSSIEEFNKVVYKHFSKQYSENLLEDFKQLDDSKKFIIIDDFDKTKLNSRYSISLLSNISKYYKHIIITGNELLKFHDFLYSGEVEESETAYFNKYEIMPFGHQLRWKLINRWNTLGDIESIDEEDLISRNNNFENKINTIIGNNFVPPLPFFLLVILQSLESGNTHNLSESTYGYYYEHLIRQAFIKINIENEDIDAFYNYITELAYLFFCDQQSEKSYYELNEFHVWYCKTYDLTIDLGKNISKLVETSILSKLGDTYKFKYKYTYYYFVARYLSVNITDSKIKDEISNMCSKLFVEEFANIMMFLTHLSKDPFILNELLNNSEHIFDEFVPTKLEEDIVNLNKLIVDIPKLIIKDKDVQQHREEKLYAKDQLERARIEISTNEDNDELEVDMDIIGQLNWSFKTLEILGQILKNYYGSIRGDHKITLASEAYNLGLRSLDSFLSVINTHSESLIKEIEKIIEEKHVTSNEEITKLATHFVFNLCCTISYQFVKKVSSSVGSDKLSDTFRRVLQSNDTVAVKLIDLSVKLDHKQVIPVSEIEQLKNELKRNNLIGYSLLRGLVINHLYMFKINFREKQRICKLLNISIESHRKKELLHANKR